jgi:DNA polymerase-3 subunit delta
MPAAPKVRGGDLWRKIDKELARGWSPGLTVLSGDDLYHLDRAQRRLIEVLTGDDPSEFGLTVFGDEKVDLSAVLAAARSVGMFSTRRVVFVGNLAAIDGEAEAIQAYAEHPPPQSYLIVRAPTLDQRRKLHQVLAKKGRLLKFEGGGARYGRGERDVVEMARERDLEVDSSTAAFLNQIAAGDLYRLSNELDKIRAWLGEGERRITPEIVREVAASGGLLSGWEVADAVLRRDRAAALAAARKLVDAGDEPIRVVGGLAWRARVMLQARAMLDAGSRPGDVVKATRSFYYREALLHGVSRYSVAELLRFPSILMQADKTLKSRSIDPRAVLENLVDRLTGVD